MGAVAGTGETVFLDRVAQYFADYRDGDGALRQMDIIHDELAKRLLEGVPHAVLLHNAIIFSAFNGVETLLYSIPTEPFFDVFEKDGVDMIRPRMHPITEREIGVTCFNFPPDMTSLQQFQRNIKPLAEFNNDNDFVLYYINHLKQVFATHATIDPSITTSFDLYIQSCETGNGIAIHIENFALPSTIPKNLNFWDRKR